MLFWHDEDTGLRMGTEQDFCNGTSCAYHIPCGATPNAASIVTDEPIRTVVYAISYIVEKGGRCFEGEMGEVSDCVDLGYDDPNANIAFPLPAGVDRAKIYRLEPPLQLATESIDLDSEWFCIGETDGTSFMDNVQTCDMTEPHLLYDEFMTPPPLESLTRTDKGIYVGNIGNVIYWSLPGEPFSFSDKRSKCIQQDDGDIICIAKCLNDIVIFTDCEAIGGIFGQGDFGPSLELYPSKENHVLCSKKSIVELSSGLGFVTECGIFSASISSGGLGAPAGTFMAPLMPYLSINQWQGLDPCSMAVGVYKDMLYISSSVCGLMLPIGNGVNQPDGAASPVELNLAPQSVIDASDHDNWMYEEDGECRFVEGVTVGATQIHSGKDGIYFVKENEVWKFNPNPGTVYEKGKREDVAEGECCEYFYQLPQDISASKLVYKYGKIIADGDGDTYIKIQRICCGINQKESCETICYRKIKCMPTPLGRCKRSDRRLISLYGKKTVYALWLATSKGMLTSAG